FFLILPPPPISPLFPYTTLFRSDGAAAAAVGCVDPVVEPVFEAVDPMLLISLVEADQDRFAHVGPAITVGVFRVKNLRRGADEQDRKSTRLNSSHLGISYAVFCL